MAAFFAAAFFVNGIVAPYFPVLLVGRGLSGEEIAFVLAVPYLGRLVSMPLITNLADRFDKRLVMAGVTGLMLAAGIVLGPLSDPMAVMAAASLLLLLNAAIAPLTDAIALAMERRGLGDYGRMRLWGSVSFIVGNLIGGFVLDHLGDAAIYGMTLVGSAMALIACTIIPRPGPVPRIADAAALVVLRRPAFLAVLAAGAFIQAGHAALYGFATLTWQARGFDEVVIGAFWAVGVIAEITLFAMVGRLTGRISPISLIAFAGIVGAIRWMLFAADTGVLMTGLISVMHAGSFGVGHIGMMKFIRERVPEQRAASAQGTYMVLLGVLLAAAMAVAGRLWTTVGDDAFIAMSAFSLTGLAILAASRPGIGRLPLAARTADAA